LKPEENTLTVEVTPGAAEGSRITFARQGDQAIKKIPSNIFSVSSKSADQYQRMKTDPFILSFC